MSCKVISEAFINEELLILAREMRNNSETTVFHGVCVFEKWSVISWLYLG